MTWPGLKLRLRALFHPRRAEADLDDELAFHLAMQARKRQSGGASVSDADRLAAHDFGGITQVREDCRDQRGLRFVEPPRRTSATLCADFAAPPDSSSPSSPLSPSDSGSTAPPSPPSMPTCCVPSLSATRRAYTKCFGTRPMADHWISPGNRSRIA